MSYPDELIRGIASKDYIDEDGRTSASLFQFGDTIREDGFSEASINWLDDESAIDCAMKQLKKDGSIQFKAGVAILPRDWIDMLMRQQTGKGVLNYERAQLEDNPYHGNLLRKDRDIDKKIKNVIAASIAMGVKRIIKHPQDQ